MSEQLFIMEGNGQVAIYNGNYSEYRISLDTPKEKPENKQKQNTGNPTPAPAVKKLSYKEQKELEDLEFRIASIEKEISLLTNSLTKIDSANYTELQAVTKSIEDLTAELEEKSERWLLLSEA
ncbi:ABC transporter ATPase component [compost metagenome]